MGSTSGKCSSALRLAGKTALVTGCNTGIGLCTVEDFVRRGARVVMACRDVEKAQRAAEDVRTRTADVEGVGSVRVVQLDLASLASVRACAKLLLDSEPHINLLVNNAGVMMCPELRTEDGFEMQLGTNHLGHFLFTCLLLPRIRASAPARIVNVSSDGYKWGDINFENLNWEKNYNARVAYGQSKLANILFTQELTKRLEAAGVTGVTTYSLHPGVVATELGRHLDTTYFKGLRWFFRTFGKLFIITPEQGAQTSIYCSVSEDVANESGHFYRNCKKASLSSKAQNPEKAAKLWEESVKLVNLGNWDPFTAQEVPESALSVPPKDN
ncbi:hypothetical protein R5R35_011799 [Gryllus longicercus]|uniref:Uncharacterized protein n=1 Tax=Gryllus longicercus TaxID=2509291 RepID=A0AAN9W092_9ORTH